MTANPTVRLDRVTGCLLGRRGGIRGEFEGRNKSEDLQRGGEGKGGADAGGGNEDAGNGWPDDPGNVLYRRVECHGVGHVLPGNERRDDG
ncbi:MAG: hypothetical protein R2839_08045 [Thermomicrobiales bacterium]